MDNFTNPDNNTQNTTVDYSQPGTFTGESAAWQSSSQTEQGPVYTESYSGSYEDVSAGYTAEPEKKEKIGFAIASLILGILSIICCCFGLGWITAIPGVILGIVTVVKKYAGKGCAIAGIICSALAIVLSIVMLIWTIAAGTSLMDYVEDYSYSSDYYY